MNSQFIVRQADQFANRLAVEAGDDPATQVRRAFLLAFQREPVPEELQPAGELIREHGLAAFCRALLNSNEFLFVF